ncbi:hypothetical protein OV090_40265 [Nannocystis sp. RBIL2]|uniref:hypothetical protein n=1 Tax=Nannocystis sp. RBIL2 TaxID=2996788 RepID=UPI00226F23D4|nr:hypothetical protein [Nannocystis sp. RBIL2]MCY1071046.1 hypothetical protein [Nannocystis sp. RBIL2]
MPAPALARLLARPSSLLALLLACGGSGGTTTTESASTGDSSSGTTAETTSTSSPTTSTSTATSDEPTSSSTSTTTGELTDTGVGPTSETTTTTGDLTTGELSTTTTTTSSTSTTDDTTTTGDTTTSTSTGDTTTGDTTTGEPGELGELSGDCGLIDLMELESPEPFVFTGAIDFGVVGYDYDLLTAGGQQIYDEGNLNPGSLYSEIVAYEVLARCETAALLKTEATIVYTNPMGKKTDFLAEIDGLKVGVSVVRAVGFPKDAPWTVAQADTILKGKLGDIKLSSANVAPADAWVKQILSVVAYGPMHKESLLTAYAALDPALKADTILVITVTDGDDAFIYN